MFKKLYKTVPKDVALNYFCGYTYLISISRQIKVSIKNYKISLRIKYFVRDLIYYICFCA